MFETTEREAKYVQGYMDRSMMWVFLRVLRQVGTLVGGFFYVE